MISLVVLLALVTPSSEVARLQAHFATVEHELRAADTSALSPAQRAHRAELVADLGRYAARGEFPRNLTLDATTPVFIDDRGVRCAMAHLIEIHGGAAYVAHVAATANTAYVRELAPELQPWLVENGLTAAEAARIQPSYPRMTGERCNGSLYHCTTGTCQATDDPRLSYCSRPCDPQGEPCPVGLDDVPMECRERDGQFACLYPEPVPGSIGYACDPETATFCVDSCVGEGHHGVCTGACSDVQACDPGYLCESREGAADYLRRCLPADEDGGCNSAHPAGSLLALLGLSALVLLRRSA